MSLLAPRSSTRSDSVDRVDAPRGFGLGRLFAGPMPSSERPRDNPMSESPPPGLGRGRGWFFAAVWLAYLIPVVQAAWSADSTTRRLGGVAIVAVFAVFYIRVFYLARAYRWMGAPKLHPLEMAWILGISAFLTVVACVLIGQPGTAFTVYLGVMTILIVPMPAGAIGVGVLMAATFVATRYVPGWTQDDGLVGSIFLAGLAIWGISQMISRNRQLALANEEITALAVAQERTRFSRDLHDLLGHSLTVITIKTELAGRLVSLDPARAEAEIADVERLARDALADVRAAVAGYREVTLSAELSSAARALEAAGITADLPTALDSVPGDRRELFGWVVREGVTNVVRHSGAARCRIAVSRSSIEIVDDGSGPSLSSPVVASSGFATSVGTGLIGLRERASAVGATVTVGRADDGGFRLCVGW